MSHHARSTESTFAARKRSTAEVLRRVAVFLRPYPWLAVGTVAAAVLSLLASFAFPKLTQVASRLAGARDDRVARRIFPA
jgi:hypothetical protein